MLQLPEVFSWDPTASAPASWELSRPTLERTRWYFLLQLWPHATCCPDSHSWSPFLSHVFCSFYNFILLSLSSLLYIKVYIHISDLVSQDYITISIYTCSCISVSLQPKRQQKAMPWVACPWWILPGTAKAGSCPSPAWRPRRDSASEAAFWHCPSFLFPFHMCFSLGLGFAFSFQKENWNPAITVAERAPICLH